MESPHQEYVCKVQHGGTCMYVCQQHGGTCMYVCHICMYVCKKGSATPGACEFGGGI